ncbi:MAG: hypothetical protein AAF335_04830 [Bacteroidota bacterium]
MTSLYTKANPHAFKQDDSTQLLEQLSVYFEREEKVYGLPMSSKALLTQKR